ncbi:MAG: hypothetical protein ACOCP1_02910, partial [Campylobacterales bacterium]
VLDASSDRNKWETEEAADDDNNTKITGPASGEGGVSDDNAEINTGKHWLYRPSSGAIILTDNE